MKIFYKMERLYSAALMIFFVAFGAADCAGQDNHFIKGETWIALKIR
jgi:hypothetical protein